VLPLVDSVTQAAHDGLSAGQFILIVGVLVGAINFYAMLIILLTVLLQRIYDRRSAAARLAPAAQSS
jgi:hypoxanthine-guanine phosphoribosyltransferase